MRLLVALVASLASACSAAPSRTPKAASPPSATASVGALTPGANRAVSSPAPCGGAPREIGRIVDRRLNEVSGVVESTKNPDVLFVHNDSGDSPRFFAINRAGELLAELRLESVPRLIDAEDIALGPGPGGGSFLYLGDTGNNFASFGVGIPRRKAVIYRVPEPDIDASARHRLLPLREAWPIVFTFPRGARDIEAFFIDPQSGALVLITKQVDGQSQVLTASAAQLAFGGGELTWLGELRFGQAPLPGSTMPTGASISKDGRAILVRTYSSVFLFPRPDGEPVMSALRRAPKSYPSPPELQGEAISFVDGDSSFVTISEGTQPPIYCASLQRDEGP